MKLPNIFFPKINFSRKSYYALTAISVVLLLVIGAIYVHYHKLHAISVPATADTTAFFVTGKITNSSGTGIQGTLTAQLDNGIKLETPTTSLGSFELDNIDPASGQTDVDATITFADSSGIIYLPPGDEGIDDETLYSGEFLNLDGWTKTSIVGSIIAPPPTITNSSSSPLTFTVSDTSSTDAVSSATYYYKTSSSGGWQVASLNGGPTSFTAALPTSVTAGTVVQYFIAVTDLAGNQVWSPAQGISTPASFTVAAPSVSLTASSPLITPNNVGSNLTLKWTISGITPTSLTMFGSVLAPSGVSVPTSSTSVTYPNSQITAPQNYYLKICGTTPGSSSSSCVNSNSLFVGFSSSTYSTQLNVIAPTQTNGQYITTNGTVQLGWSSAVTGYNQLTLFGSVLAPTGVGVTGSGGTYTNINVAQYWTLEACNTSTHVCGWSTSYYILISTPAPGAQPLVVTLTAPSSGSTLSRSFANTVKFSVVDPNLGQSIASFNVLDATYNNGSWSPYTVIKSYTNQSSCTVANPCTGIITSNVLANILGYHAIGVKVFDTAGNSGSAANTVTVTR